MPNWAYNRLTLSGPASEIARFRHTCIRPQMDGAEDTFDFSAIIPMPPEIFMTTRDDSPETKQIALAAAGFEDWYDWSLERWGCKWNARDLEMLNDDETLIDLFFMTPWSPPEPVFRAIAMQFPSLTGSVCAIDDADDWGLVGHFQSGTYASECVDSSTELHFLVAHWNQSPAIRQLIGYLLGEELDCFDDDATIPNTDDVSAYKLEDLLAKLEARLPPGLWALVRFEGTVWRFNEGISGSARQQGASEEFDEGSISDSEASAVGFLMADGRTYFPIDRELMHMLAKHLCSIWSSEHPEDEADDDMRRELAFLLTGYDDSDLWEWAAHAAFRPGVKLDLSDLKYVQESFVTYAMRMRQHMQHHVISQLQRPSYRSMLLKRSATKGFGDCGLANSG